MKGSDVVAWCEVAVEREVYRHVFRLLDVVKR